MHAVAQYDDLPDHCVIETERDLALVRKILRRLGEDIGLGAVELAKLITAGSELARNVLRYGDRGHMQTSIESKGDQRGVKAIFKDHGGGIEDIDLAMQDGYSSIRSLGIGLPGARRLADEFHIQSSSTSGTEVVIVTWRH